MTLTPNNMQGFKALLSKGKKEITGPIDMPEPMSPNICLDSRQFPDMKDWALGKEYTFKARYKSKQENDDGHIHGDFEIVAAEGKPAEGEEDEEAEEESTEAEELIEGKEKPEAEMNGYDE
jgi:hypothetical protein